MAALDALTFALKVQVVAKAVLNRTGLDAQTVPLSIKPSEVKLNTDVGPAVAGGANQMIGAVYTVTANSTLSIDLNSFTDMPGRTAQAMARIKGYFFWLLGTADSSVGTACSGVSIGPHGTNGHALNLTGTTPAFTVNNGEFVVWGSRQAAGKVVDGTHKVILVTNNDLVVDGKLLVAIPGGVA